MASGDQHRNTAEGGENSFRSYAYWPDSGVSPCVTSRPVAARGTEQESHTSGVILAIICPDFRLAGVAQQSEVSGCPWPGNLRNDRPPEDIVGSIAAKISGFAVMPNVHHLTLCLGDLLG
jgi:hypothetical protein